MLGVELSARAAAAAPPSPPPPAVSCEARRRHRRAPPRRRRRPGLAERRRELRAGPDPARRAPGGVASLQIRGRGPVPARVGAAGGRRRGGRRGAVQKGAALRLAVRRGAGRRRCVSTATLGRRHPPPARGGPRPLGAAAVVRSTPLAGTLVAIKVAGAAAGPRRAGWRRPNRPPPRPRRRPPLPRGAGVVARRVAPRRAAHRVAVRGATLVLAVAPPDAPGRSARRPGLSPTPAARGRPAAAEAARTQIHYDVTRVR